MVNNWAIAIGINKYDNLQPLKYAQRDAEVMAAWFEEEANFDQVFLFTENSPDISLANPPIPTQPNYARFQRFLDVQFEKPLLRPEDNLWFFFAGHGRRYADKDYLMFLDSNPQAVDRTAISVDYVTQRLRRSGADNVVLFIDACRDEDSRSGLGIGQQEFKGVITFYSCAANQKSWEIDELQHGSFTHALLEGLRIQGEANCATVERLQQHLGYHVPRLNIRYRKSEQNPYLMAEPPYKMYYILLENVATDRDAEPLKNRAYQAESKGDLKLAEKLWMRVLALPGVDEDARIAIERIRKKLDPERSRIEKCRHLFQLFSIIATRRNFLRWIFWGGGGLVAAEVARKYFTEPNPPPPPPPPPTPNPISLEKFNFEVVTVNPQGIITNRRNNEAELFKEDLGNDVTLEMVSIPRGSFKMGTEDKEIEKLLKKNPNGSEVFTREKPQHEVTVAAFFMGRFEVTQEQYQQVMDKNPSKFKGNKRPVESVSWNDAVEFCEKLSQKTGRNYRLPSEAEWEYACRAGTTTPFHFGETITSELVNYREPETKPKCTNETTPVGQFPANAFGLYDMHGNLWEWCQDTLHDNYDGAPIDGSPWIDNNNDSFRMVRGGSRCNLYQNCRSASRGRFDSNNSNDNRNGLRVVCV